MTRRHSGWPSTSCENSTVPGCASIRGIRRAGTMQTCGTSMRRFQSVSISYDKPPQQHQGERAMKIRYAAVLIGCVSAGLAGPSALKAEDQITITFTGSGGALQEAETKYYFEPYLKLQPNIKIQQDSPINYAKLQAMVEAGNVTWDLAEGGPGFGLSPQHTKLLEKVDCNVVPCAHLQPDKYPTTGYRIAENTSATVL